MKQEGCAFPPAPGVGDQCFAAVGLLFAIAFSAASERCRQQRRGQQQRHTPNNALHKVAPFLRLSGWIHLYRLLPGIVIAMPAERGFHSFSFKKPLFSVYGEQHGAADDFWCRAHKAGNRPQANAIRKTSRADKLI